MSKRIHLLNYKAKYFVLFMIQRVIYLKKDLVESKRSRRRKLIRYGSYLGVKKGFGAFMNTLGVKNKSSNIHYETIQSKMKKLIRALVFIVCCNTTAQEISPYFVCVSLQFQIWHNGYLG